MGILDFFKSLFMRRGEEASRLVAKQGRKRTRRKKTASRGKKKPAKKPVKKIKKPRTAKRSLPRPKARLKFKEQEIGVVTHYFGKISVGIIKLKSGLKVGEEVRIKGRGEGFIQIIDSMQLNHKNIEFAPKGSEIGIKVVRQVCENDKVYRVALA